MHLGMGLVCGAKIRDMVEANFNFTIFLADWHAWINNKLGSNLKNIRTSGEYFKHCFTALGIDPAKVTYRWASDLVGDSSYWEKVIRIAKNTTLQRTWRTLPIMGREMSLADIETAWIFYPCLQSADIFQMDLDVACAGMDQRKAHMLARDVSEKLGWKKPISIHTHLLMGLSGSGDKMEAKFDENKAVDQEISAKMSKSIPTSAIFIHDSPEDIRMKFQGAYCPQKKVEGNPVLEIARYVVFSWSKILSISRLAKYGGPIEFQSYTELEKAYVNREVHPLDLKNGVAEALIEILKPVRDYFERHPEPLEQMKKIEITR
jgi:tyrosyl-tRNA synthetase